MLRDGQRQVEECLKAKDVNKAEVLLSIWQLLDIVFDLK